MTNYKVGPIDTAGHLMSCTATNMRCLLCSMQMFNLAYISSEIQNTVCKQMAPVATKKYLMKIMFTLLGLVPPCTCLKQRDQERPVVEARSLTTRALLPRGAAEQRTGQKTHMV